MIEEFEEKEMMHKPGLVSGLIIAAEVTAWVMLVLYLLSFVSDMISVSQNFAAIWPSQLMDQIMTLAGLVFKPAIGAFYFVMLQGVAQILSLGVDIFYNTDVAYEEIVEEVVAE